ncbi:MAG: ABC transporter permease subunit [Oscillospiraceae bacterium]|jgi:putative aldouronate transport system permease protein|nr:ABC transporter permease subunit [Oscillospiraceae bacterium]
MKLNYADLTKAKSQKIGIRAEEFRKNFLRDWQLYLLILLPLIYILIFHYGPMYGLQMAFRNYRAADGITGSEWVGLKWFEKFLTNRQFKQVFSNTFILSIYNLAIGFPLPIIFALMLNTLRREKYKRLIQTVSYMPHFISLAVAVSLVSMVLSPVNGVYGGLYNLLGGSGYPVDFRSTAGAFRHIYVWSDVWQQLGWNSIIFIAALSSVSPELHEAAQIDGASRFKRVLHVDLPAILPTICIMLILRCGSIISVGFEKAYLMQTGVNLQTAEVISTYVYKVGMGSFRDFSYGAAVGLFNNVINLVLLLIVNYVCKKMTSDDVSLF